MEKIKKLIRENVDPGYEFEIFLQKIKKTKIEVSDEKLENISTSEEAGVAIRVLKDNRLGFSYTSSVEEGDLLNALRRAQEMCDLMEEDEGNSFITSHRESSTRSVFDGEGLEVPLENKIDLAVSLERKAKDMDGRIKGVRKASFTETVFEVNLYNSFGVEFGYEGTAFSAMVATLAESNGDSSISWEYRASRRLKELSVEDIVSDVVFKTVSLLNPRPIQTCTMPVVFFRESFAMITEAFSDMFLGDALIKNKTLLKGKEDQRIASEVFTLVDDGTLEGGFMTTPYDDEGYPKGKKEVIKMGVFKGFLHSLYTARTVDAEPTGNSLRGSYRNPPRSGITNLYVSAGNFSFEELLGLEERVFLVLELMGLHTVDPVSGDFSLGASGVLVEGGRPVHAVRGVTIASNILDIWKNISAVGKDLKFYGNVGSPSVLVKDITVGGR